MSLNPLVETLFRLAAQDEDAVSVSDKNDRGTMVYTVNVAPGDVGRVIGKDGRVVQCIRNVVSAVGAKGGSRTVVKVVARD